MNVLGLKKNFFKYLNTKIYIMQNVILTINFYGDPSEILIL